MSNHLLIFSSHDSNMRYATGLNISDPFIWMKLGKQEVIIVNTLEYSRARREARPNVKVVLLDTLDLNNVRKPAARKRNLADVAASFLRSYNITEILVAENCWASHLGALQEHGLRPRIKQPFFPERAEKTPEEIKHIKAAGIAAKKAFKHALEIVKASRIEWNDTLTYKKQRVTSEFLRNEIEKIFIEHDCSSGETSVACGEQSAEPHNRGSGPIYAGQPIIFDLFPKSNLTGYYFDMSRTVIKGTPSKELRRMYNAVRKAQQDALDTLEPGSAKKIHNVCETVFEKAGYETTAEEGFLHSTGHGLGLDIHELPRITGKVDDELKPGNVVTIEPGLYYKELGGVRIEDTVVITKQGHQNLTNIPKVLIVP